MHWEESILAGLQVPADWSYLLHSRIRYQNFANFSMYEKKFIVRVGNWIDENQETISNQEQKYDGIEENLFEEGNFEERIEKQSAPESIQSSSFVQESYSSRSIPISSSESDFFRSFGFDLAPFQDIDSCYGKEPVHDDSFSTNELFDRILDEENKYEVNECLQYPDDDGWIISVPINISQCKDESTTEIVMYSYDKGLRRIELPSDEITKDIKLTNLLKYKSNKDRTGYEIKPLYSAMPSTQLITLKVRYNKGIDMKVYGLTNFVDFEKDPDAHSLDTVVWTDAVGVVLVSPAERSVLWRKQIHSESEIFAPLRLCNLTVRADFTLSSQSGSHPKWTISSAHPIIEEQEDDKSVQIGRSLWPARVLRFDDLVYEYVSKNGYHFKSFSQPNVRVLASPHLKGIIESAGMKYVENGVFSGVVYPKIRSKLLTHYEALIIGPLKVLTCITENRIFNYCPKTWPPSLKNRSLEEERLKASKFEKDVKESYFYFDHDKELLNLCKHGVKRTQFGYYEV